MSKAIEAEFVKKMKRPPTDAEMEHLAEVTRELYGARRVLSQFDRQESVQIRPAIRDRKVGKEAESE